MSEEVYAYRAVAPRGFRGCGDLCCLIGMLLEGSGRVRGANIFIKAGCQIYQAQICDSFRTLKTLVKK